MALTLPLKINTHRHMNNDEKIEMKRLLINKLLPIVEVVK